jgi:LTXXQ motif family protein
VRPESNGLASQRPTEGERVSVLVALRSCAAGPRARCCSGLRPVFRASLYMAATLLFIVPLLTFEATARGGGGGHGGGGFGGHSGGIVGGRGGGLGLGGASSFGPARFGGTSVGVRSFGVAPFGRTSPGVRSFGVAPFGRTSVGVRSFGGAPFGGRNVAARPFGVAPVGGSNIAARSFAARSFAGRSLTLPRIGIATARLAGSGGRFITGSSLSTANWGRGVFGSRAIAGVAWRSQFASARFHGRFFGSRWWPGWRGGLVTGWVGPLFWPYAYDDVFDYLYWPYAYDDFWPYAYDDIYYGIYGNHAYVDPGVGGVGRGASSPAWQMALGEGSQWHPVSVCSDNAVQLTDWPIERISEIVQPADAQRSMLDELRAASVKAIDMLKSGCPKDLPSIPTGRLAAMESRLQVMLAAVQAVRPALERVYQSLSDEQKARFNAIAPADDPEADERDLTNFCDEETQGVTDLPIDRIAQAVQPTLEQQSAPRAMTAPLLNTMPAWTAAKIEADGQSDALRLTAEDVSINEVLAALSTKFNLTYSSELPLDRTVAGTYSGTLQQVIRCILDGYDYVINVSAERFELKILSRSTSVAKPSTLPPPTQAITQPTPEQQAALDQLKDASVKAAERLKVDCTSYQISTPTVRVEAMEKRLDATLGAVKTMRPALTKFYNSLSDEQKARFNSLRSAPRPLG